MEQTTTESGERRGRGRPRRFVPNRVRTAVRFTPTRYAALRAAANAAGRSVSEEVEARIERCATYDDTLAAMRAGVLILPDARAKRRENVEA
jgi:hypothetical protein